MRAGKFLSTLVVIAGLVLCGVPLSAAEITVFAAASLTDSIREIAADFEKSTSDRVVINFGASSTLARQIEEGAPADIFFSADEAQMDRLENKALLVEGTRRDRLSNILVIIIAADHGASVREPKDLVRPEIRRIALGDPRGVPVGVYAKEYLDKQGLWKDVASKVVPTENVRGALGAVASGNAEAGIVYRTDALISRKVAVAYTVPREEGPRIRYPAALLRGARDLQAAKRFLEFSASLSARRVFEKEGFGVLP